MKIIFENGVKQLVILESSTMVILSKGRDYYYPQSIKEGLEKMLNDDRDCTLDALAEMFTK